MATGIDRIASKKTSKRSLIAHRVAELAFQTAIERSAP
jgi:hypothetical protein